MADRRLDQSTALTSLVAGDLLLVGDISDTHPITGAPIIKKATVLNAGQSMMSVIVSAATSVTSLTGSNTFLLDSGTSKITYSNIITSLTNELPFQTEATTSITTITSSDTFLIASKTSLITYGNLLTRLTSDLPFSTGASTAGGITNNVFPTAYVDGTFTANDTSQHTYSTLEDCLSNVIAGYVIYLAPGNHVISSTVSISNVNFIGANGNSIITIQVGTTPTEFTGCYFFGLHFTTQGNLTFTRCTFGGANELFITDDMISYDDAITLTLDSCVAEAAVHIAQSDQSNGFKTVNCSGNFNILNIRCSYVNATSSPNTLNLTTLDASRVNIEGYTHVKIDGSYFGVNIEYLEASGTFFEFNNKVNIINSNIDAYSICYNGSDIIHKGTLNVWGIVTPSWPIVSSLPVSRLFQQGFVNIVGRSNYSGTDIVNKNINADITMAFVNAGVDAYSGVHTLVACLNDNTTANQTISNPMSTDHNINITLKDISYFVSTNYPTLDTSSLTLIVSNVVDVLHATSSKTYSFANSKFKFTTSTGDSLTNTCIGMFTNGIKMYGGFIKDMRLVNSEISIDRVGIYASEGGGVVRADTNGGYFENTDINIGNVYVDSLGVSCASRTIIESSSDLDMLHCTFNMGPTYIANTSSLTELVYSLFNVTAASSVRIDGCTFNLNGFNTASTTAQLSWRITGLKNSVVNLSKENHTMGAVSVGGDNNNILCNNNSAEIFVVMHGDRNNIHNMNVTQLFSLFATASNTVLHQCTFGTATFTDNATNTKFINPIDNFITSGTTTFLRRDGTFATPVASVDFGTLTAITTITGSDTFVVASRSSVITYTNLLSRLQADISASGTSGGTFSFGSLTAITTITGSDTFAIASQSSVITYTNLLVRLQADITASASIDFGTLTAITTITGSDTFVVASQSSVITYTNLLSRIQADISASGTGGFANDFPIATVTANTTANTAHFTILVECNSADITITLPAAASSNKIMYHIKKIDETSGNVIIDPNGSELIDGDTSHSITTPFAARTIHCNGSAWYII